MTIKFVTILIALFSFGSINAQDSKKTVILYNVVPLSVELLQDGTIKTIYGKADHYFKGYQIVKREVFFTENSNNNEFAALDGEIVVSTDAVRLLFDDQLAILNQSIIERLDNVKNELFLDPAKKIILSTYSVDENNKRAVVLLQNRLASCLSYLEIMGVSKDRIVLDPKSNDKDSNTIMITETVNATVVNSQD